MTQWIMFKQSYKALQIYTKAKWNDSSVFQASMLSRYRIAQNFGGKKHWQIWWMNLYSPMFFSANYFDY